MTGYFKRNMVAILSQVRNLWALHGISWLQIIHLMSRSHVPPNTHTHTHRHTHTHTHTRELQILLSKYARLQLDGRAKVHSAIHPSTESSSKQTWLKGNMYLALQFKFTPLVSLTCRRLHTSFTLCTFSQLYKPQLPYLVNHTNSSNVQSRIYHYCLPQVHDCHTGYLTCAQQLPTYFINIKHQ